MDVDYSVQIPVRKQRKRSVAGRFFQKILVSETRFFEGTPCWEWQGCVDDSGYGRFDALDEFYAHRVSHKLFIIPSKQKWPILSVGRKKIDHKFARRAGIEPASQSGSFLALDRFSPPVTHSSCDRAPRCAIPQQRTAMRDHSALVQSAVPAGLYGRICSTADCARSNGWNSGSWADFSLARLFAARARYPFNCASMKPRAFSFSESFIA